MLAKDQEGALGMAYRGPRSDYSEVSMPRVVRDYEGAARRETVKDGRPDKNLNLSNVAIIRPALSTSLETRRV